MEYAHNLILNSRGAHYAIACLYNTIHILKRCDLTVCHQLIGRHLDDSTEEGFRLMTTLYICPIATVSQALSFSVALCAGNPK